MLLIYDYKEVNYELAIPKQLAHAHSAFNVATASHVDPSGLMWALHTLTGLPLHPKSPS